MSSPLSGESHYQLLGVGRDATSEEIKRAYRQKAQINHPDLGGDDEMMKKINEAYRILQDEDLKAIYDDESEEMSVLVHAARLTSGFTLSEEFKKLFNGWKEEFENAKVVDTRQEDWKQIRESLAALANSIAPQQPQTMSKKKEITITQCKICDEPLSESHLEDCYQKFKILLDSAPDIHDLLSVGVKAAQFPAIIGEDKRLEWLNLPRLQQKIQRAVRSCAETALSDVKEMLNAFSDNFQLPSKIHLPYPKPAMSNWPSADGIPLFLTAKDTNKIPKYPKTMAPIWVPDHSVASCATCNAEFWIFKGRYCCTMCGTETCFNCLLLSALPHLGYLSQVQTCHLCVKKLPKIDFDVVYQHLLQEGSEGQHECIAALYDLIQVLPKSFYETWKQLLEKVKSDHHYEALITMMWFSEDDTCQWLSQIESFFTNREFKLGYKALRMLAKKKRTEEILQHQSGLSITTRLAVYHCFLSELQSPTLFVDSICKLLEQTYDSRSEDMIIRLFAEVHKDTISPKQWMPLLSAVTLKQTIFLLAIIAETKGDRWKKICKDQAEAGHIEQALLCFKAWQMLDQHAPDLVQFGHSVSNTKASAAIYAHAWSALSQNLVARKHLVNIAEEKLYTVETANSLVSLTRNATIYLSLAKNVEPKLQTVLHKMYINAMLEDKMQNHSLLLSALHHLLKLSPTDESKILEIVSSITEASLRSEKNLAEIAKLLSTKGKKAEPAVRKIIDEQCDKQEISSLPPVVHLLLSFVKRWNNLYSESMACLNQCLMSSATSVQQTILDLVVNDEFRACIADEIIRGIAELELVEQSDIPAPKYTDRLTRNSFTNLVKKFEKGIHKANVGLLDKAWLYMDLSMAAGEPTVICNNYLIMATYCLQHLKQTDTMAEKYACYKMIGLATASTFRVAKEYLNPASQLRCMLNVLRIIQAVPAEKIENGKLAEKVISVSIGKEINQIAERAIKLSKIVPLAELSTMQSYDDLYASFVYRKFLQDLYKHMSKNPDALIPKHISLYYLFEEEWRDGKEIEGEGYRNACMETLLSSKGWNTKQVEELLQWQMLSRTPEGWLPEKEFPLQFTSGKSFYSLDSISLNASTGKISFNMTESFNGYGLFTEKDVLEILEGDVAEASFTLDQPDNDFVRHPFQEMKYAPESLQGTNFLSTMLHADYLLKMLTVGVEVSTLSPFQFKPITEGILKRLPDHLRAIFTEFHEKRNDSAFRFWIAADEIMCHQETNEATVSYHFEGVNMRLKKHLLTLNEKGELVDDIQDASDDSKEAVFARKFTKHYDELGYYFPELLRLRELLKMCAATKVLKSVHETLKQAASSHPSETQYRRALNNFEYTLQHKLRMKLNGKNVVGNMSNSGCSWVPAAFHKKEHSRVYGGVHLGVKLNLQETKRPTIEVQTNYQPKSKKAFERFEELKRSVDPGSTVSATVKATLFSQIPDTTRNRALLKAGKNPIGPDGKKMKWHHVNQEDTMTGGSVALLSHSLHKKAPHKLETKSKIHRPKFDSEREQLNRAVFNHLFGSNVTTLEY